MSDLKNDAILRIMIKFCCVNECVFMNDIQPEFTKYRLRNFENNDRHRNILIFCLNVSYYIKKKIIFIVENLINNPVASQTPNAYDFTTIQLLHFIKVFGRITTILLLTRYRIMIHVYIYIYKTCQQVCRYDNDAHRYLL